MAMITTSSLNFLMMTGDQDRLLCKVDMVFSVIYAHMDSFATNERTDLVLLSSVADLLSTNVSTNNED